MKKKVYKYVISYIFTEQDGGQGYGSANLEWNFKINNFKQVIKIREYIIHKYDFKDICIQAISYLGKGVAEFETN